MFIPSFMPARRLHLLQGRLPIRVELKALSRQDFYRILTEPQFNLVKQQQASGTRLPNVPLQLHR